METAASRTETFAALGCTIDLVTRPWAAEGLEITREVMADIDASCSRFRADSELTRLNAGAGGWVRVGSLLLAALRIALEAAEQTDGLVNPCLGRSLRSLGYDADLDLVKRRDHGGAVLPVVAPRIAAWSEVEMDPAGAVRLPPDVEIDLGATGKAFAADLAALSVHERLGVDVAVSAGGDVRIVNETGDLWPVEIAEGPTEPAQDVVSLLDGGIATSSTTQRRWTRGGIVRHHIVDPRTGLPSTGPWRSVTASGPTCVAANVAATAAIILGDAALEWLGQRGVWARLVDDEGRVTVVGDASEPA